MEKRIQVDWIDTNDVEHTIKSTQPPHPDFNVAVEKLHAHLIVSADLKSDSRLRVKSIEINENEDSESITVVGQKLLPEGEVATISFPTIPIKNSLVPIVDLIAVEAYEFARAKKLAQQQMDFTDPEEGMQVVPGEAAVA